MDGQLNSDTPGRASREMKNGEEAQWQEATIAMLLGSILGESQVETAYIVTNGGKLRLQDFVNVRD